VAAEGDLIAGRYRLLGEAGRGGMGVVWQARDERLDRLVAVKELFVDDGPAEHADRRGVREGRVAARVRHPHAVMIHDVLWHAEKPFLVMEYFPARSLSRLGTLAPGEAARVGSQVASALSAAHAEGIVHRDVKPGNILIAADGTAKIADFGIAKALGDGTVTETGMFAGTPAFLAPEVAAGGPAIFAADVFSLGATLYTATEGSPPFGVDDNPIVLLHRIAHDSIVPPRQSGPLTEVMLWMLGREPAERPTMQEAYEALTAVAEGRPAHPPPLRPSTPDPTLILPARRPSRRAIAAAVAALCLVAGGVVIGTIIASGSSTQASPPETRTVAPAPTTTVENSRCDATFDVTGSWPGGYNASVTVRNNGSPVLSGWTVRWTLPAGHTISNLWNGTLSQNGSSVTVTNASWNATVDANGSTEFGLTANLPGSTQPAGNLVPTLSCQAPR
jgi:serine/threonine protein kinase